MAFTESSEKLSVLCFEGQIPVIIWSTTLQPHQQRIETAALSPKFVKFKVASSMGVSPTL